MRNASVPYKKRNVVNNMCHAGIMYNWASFGNSSPFQCTCFLNISIFFCLSIYDSLRLMWFKIEYIDLSTSSYGCIVRDWQTHDEFVFRENNMLYIRPDILVQLFGSTVNQGPGHPYQFSQMLTWREVLLVIT